jgi:hypothetical protein
MSALSRTLLALASAGYSAPQTAFCGGPGAQLLAHRGNRRRPRRVREAAVDGKKFDEAITILDAQMAKVEAGSYDQALVDSRTRPTPTCRRATT